MSTPYEYYELRSQATAFYKFFLNSKFCRIPLHSHYDNPLAQVDRAIKVLNIKREIVLERDFSHNERVKNFKIFVGIFSQQKIYKILKKYFVKKIPNFSFSRLMRKNLQI